MLNEISHLKEEIITIKEINESVKKNNEFLQLVIKDVINANMPNTYKWNNLFSKTVRQIYSYQNESNSLTNYELVHKREIWKAGLGEINRNNYIMNTCIDGSLWNIENFKNYNRELIEFETEMYFSKLRFLYSDYMINSIYFERNIDNLISGEAFQYSNNLSNYINKNYWPKSFEKEYRDFYKINNKNINNYIRPFNQ